MSVHGRLATGAALAAGIGGQLAWRLGLGLWGAQGGDAQLWGLAAESVAHGAPPGAPPLVPMLVAGLRWLGLPLVPAAWGLSLALGALVPVAVLAAARALGARLPSALAAALATALLPDLLAWGSEVQSNTAIALGLVTATGLWARASRDGGRFGVAAAVLTGLLPLVRETGTLAALGAMLAAPVLVPRGGRLSLLVLATWWLSPLLSGVLPGVHPFDVPWAPRVGMAVHDLLGGGTTGVGGRPPPYTAELPPQDRGVYLAWLREGALLKLGAYHAARSLRLAWDGHLLAAVAVVGVLAGLRRRPRTLLALWVPLLTLAPTAVMWTQRRHVLLAVPALLAGLAAMAWPDERPKPRWTAGLVGVAVLAAMVGWLGPARQHAHGQQGETARARSLAGLATWICDERDPMLLSGPVHDVALYCPRPRHEPDGSVADWHTILVAPAVTPAHALPRGFAPVGPRVADLQAFQLLPGAPRPCSTGRVAPGTPYLSAGPVYAVLLDCPSSPGAPAP